MKLLWRIAVETRTHSAPDLGSAGAARHPGRWNDDGQPVVYAAPSLALAVPETAAHVHDAGLPMNRCVVAIDVPAEVWAMREALRPAVLPLCWSAIPAGRASVTVGAAWLASLRSPILLVPSAIVPDESVALINPAHAASAGLAARVVRPFDYGRLFRARAQ